MPRSESTSGSLTLKAFSASRSALLVFALDQAEGSRPSGKEQGYTSETLSGFAVKRQKYDAQGGLSNPVWLGDPRRNPRLAKEGSSSSSSSPSLSNSKFGVSWMLRHLIQDFKWGDYTVEANTSYRYTLYAVRGVEADAPLGDATPQEGEAAGDEGDDDDELEAPGALLPVEATDGSLPQRGPGPHAFASVSVDLRIPHLYGTSHEVHFNRGVTGQRFARIMKEPADKNEKQWAWLSRGLEESLLHFISLAKSGWKLRAALYEAHYPPVLRAMGEARKRGVDVKLVVDYKLASWSEKKKVWSPNGPQHQNMWGLSDAGLLEPGICVWPRTKPISAISHNKFILLVKPDDSFEGVLTGSTNITSGAIFGHFNVAHVLRDQSICEQYQKYWDFLKADPQKADFAAFNDSLSPLPSDEVDNEDASTITALFSPRLNWMDSLNFFAQLIRNAKHSVFFTSAFGVGKEMSAPLLTQADHVPIYMLLEGEGNWASAREAVAELRKKKNVKLALGTHIDNVEGWIPETLTGLNQHVKYVHTKILLVDPLSDSPIVVTGSANFSRASMENNDENMLVIKGNKDVADGYVVEFFRMFEHMRFRNEIVNAALAGMSPTSQEAASPSPASDPRPKTGTIYCRCRVAACQRTVKKEGSNQGRFFLACTKGKDRGGCDFFQFLNRSEDSKTEPLLPWPERCYQQKDCFAAIERQMLNTSSCSSSTEASAAHAATSSTSSIVRTAAAGAAIAEAAITSSSSTTTLTAVSAAAPAATAESTAPADTTACGSSASASSLAQPAKPLQGTESLRKKDTLEELCEDFSSMHLDGPRQSEAPGSQPERAREEVADADPKAQAQTSEDLNPELPIPAADVQAETESGSCIGGGQSSSNTAKDEDEAAAIEEMLKVAKDLLKVKLGPNHKGGTASWRQTAVEVEQRMYLLGSRRDEATGLFIQVQNSFATSKKRDIWHPPLKEFIAAFDKSGAPMSSTSSSGQET